MRGASHYPVVVSCDWLTANYVDVTTVECADILDAALITLLECVIAWWGPAGEAQSSWNSAWDDLFRNLSRRVTSVANSHLVFLNKASRCCSYQSRVDRFQPDVEIQVTPQVHNSVG